MVIVQKSARGGEGVKVMKRKRLRCRYKVTSTHLYEGTHFVSQLGLDESKCIHHRGYCNIQDIMVCFETDESKRWRKE